MRWPTRLVPEITISVEIRDLTVADLEHLRWSGGRSHLVAIGKQLERVTAGLAEYLVACPPSGRPAGKLAIDYAARADAGLIHQVAVHGLLESCGIATLLMAAAEERIRDRARGYAELTVEHDNARARALYERLGYAAYGDEAEEWDDDQPDGSVVRYRTMCTMMRKRLS
jgi:ribosomal protein S18 acetylase RimI-like enzyme